MVRERLVAVFVIVGSGCSSSGSSVSAATTATVATATAAAPEPKPERSPTKPSASADDDDEEEKPAAFCTGLATGPVVGGALKVVKATSHGRNTCDVIVEATGELEKGTWMEQVLKDADGVIVRKGDTKMDDLKIGEKKKVRVHALGHDDAVKLELRCHNLLAK